MYCSINALIKHFKAKFEDSIWFRRQMFGRFTCNIYMGVDGLLKLMVANRQCGIYVMDRSISRIYVGAIAFCSLSHLFALQFFFSR